MDQQTIRDLLYRIATDPDFRKRLIADPVGVLGEAGIQINVSDIPPGGVELPSNEEILRNLDAWSTDIWKLDTTGSRIPRIWLGLS
jgi:hypothetical protein